MKDIQKMKRERSKLVEEMRSITVAAESRSDKKLTDQEATRWSELNAIIDTMAQDIIRAEKMNQLEIENRDTTDDNNAEVPPPSKRFDSLGDQLQAVMAASVPGCRRDERLVEVRAATGMNTTVPSDGGFLVQTDFMTEIMKRTYETGLLASRCRKIGISQNANALSWNSFDESSRAAGSRFGGVRGYWVAQASTATASAPSFKKSRLELEKLMALVYATEETLQDAVALESIVNSVVSDEFAFLLDESIVNGTGAGQPLGILNSDAVISVSKEVGQSAATIVYENIVKMWARMWSKSWANSIWLINQNVLPQLGTMAMVVGAGGVPVYLPASGASGSPYSTLFGRPVVPVEHCQTLGTAGDIILADLSQYLLVDKGGVKADTSMHVRFLYDEQVFRFTYRVNGQPTWDSALTPLYGSSDTLSPFVTLAARA